MLDILVIGYKGYIGAFLYEQLKESGGQWSIRGYDRKTGIDNDPSVSLDNVIANIDVVIYMGGITGRKDCGDKSPSYVFQENVDDIMRVAYKMKKDALLIYASTAALYEGCGKTPATETYVLNTELFDEYTRSMYWREKNISTLTHIRTLGLRLGTVIGLSPKQRTNYVHIALLRSAVLTGVAHVYDANQSRAVLWNRDLLEFVERILCQNHKITGNKVYNVSSFNCTIAKIANEVACRTGCRMIYETHSTETTNNNKYSLGFSMDTSKSKTDFGMVWKGKNSGMIEELKTNLKKICISPEYLRESPPNSGEPCRICKTSQMYVVYDFGMQPSANHYLKTQDSSLPEYPLRLDLCKNCYHTQLNYTLSPSQMFSDYIYLSGTSRTMRAYFDDFARKTTTGRNKGAVLDIACNDGSLLDSYKALGWKTFGYDPAKNIYDEISSKKGHDITVGFWGVDPVPEYPPLDIIVAQNVVAHVPDPVLFMQKCCDVMSENTVLYIQTSQAEMIERGQFDTIYHEHLSFFSVKSMMEATRRSGLYLEDVEKTDVHGISYVFKIRKQTNTNTTIESNIETNPIYVHEESIGLYDDLLYHKYIEQVNGLRSWVHYGIETYFHDSIPIIGYGAAAKGMTVLNHIGRIDMKYIVDDSPYKHNYYATNHKYLIVSPETLKEDEGPLAIIVFAWNFIDEILRKIKEIRGNRELYIMVYYPKKKIIRLSNGMQHTIFEEIDSRYTKDSLYHKTLLFSHFYNEEMLLRQWIRHHAPMFDAAVLINHHSTDSSVDIIRQEAPDSWNLVMSGTKMFCPYFTDNEVAGYELSFQSDDWRLALTTTEFLYQTSIRHRENPLLSVTTKALRFPAITMIDGNNHGYFDGNKSLIEQRNSCYIPGSLDGVKERYLHGQYNRFMHRIRNGNPYQLGRHELNHKYSTRNGFILKYMYSPYPDYFSRKLQIKNKIMQQHKEQGFGFQHLVEYDDLHENAKTHMNLPTMRLKSTDTQNMEKQIEFYDKIMSNHDSGQLLGGIYENMFARWD